MQQEVTLTIAIRHIRRTQPGVDLHAFVSGVHAGIDQAAEEIRQFSELERDVGHEFPKEMRAAWARLNAKIYAFNCLYEALPEPVYDSWKQDRARYEEIRKAAHGRMQRVEDWFRI